MSFLMAERKVDPTPEEIKELTAAIRAEWTPEQHISRRMPTFVDLGRVHNLANGKMKTSITRLNKRKERFG